MWKRVSQEFWITREFNDRSIKQFEHGTKSEKMSLTQTIVDLVKSSGGRLLIREGSEGWEEVGYGTSARKRVMTSFKARRKVHNTKPTAQLTSGSFNG
jgi:hypothetical protein